MAADVRSLVCGALRAGVGRKYHDDSPDCDALLNLTSWKTKEGFYETFAGASLAQLFAQSVQNNPNFTVPPSLLELHMHMMGEITIPGASSSNMLQRPDESSLLWDGTLAPAWVACNQKNQTCYGKIAKDVWYDPKMRAPTCLNVFSDQIRAGTVNSSAVGIDICNLNSKTNELCQVRFWSFDY